MLRVAGFSNMAASTHPTTGEPARRAPGGLEGSTQWVVRLLGAVEATGHGHHIVRWPSRAVVALLARLALAPDRMHPREELVEMLWPGVPLEAGRNRLRQALSTLRGILEPPGPTAIHVLHADRMGVRVVQGALQCDALRFEECARLGQQGLAAALYRGELMPGFYEDWVLQARQRLSDLHDGLPPTAPLAVAALPPAAHLAPTGQDLPAPTGLPSYWTRPFGVEHTATRLCGLVQGHRLVTVHGPGGSGKTRMAVEVAQALRETPAWSLSGPADPPGFDRIAFVPLIDCTAAAQALDAIANALSAEGTGETRKRITVSLIGRRVLLVLDNLEQLADEANADIAQLLAASPGLHVLTTSRRLLGLEGETAFALEGLALPPPQADADEAASSPAVALFVDRARAARADFKLCPRHTHAVVALVRLLSGMPLAIELAASRVRSLTPQQLLERLSEHAGTPMLDLLARSAQRASADVRHASMRHVVDWSWQQLGPAPQRMLLAMAVLHAPASLEAAAAVADAELEAARRVLEELQDASLVNGTEDEQGQVRHALLQPVREFAAERLPADQAILARQRLRRWLIGFARAQGTHAPKLLAPEMPLIHSAVQSARADGAAQEALILAVALRAQWDSANLPLSDQLALEQALPEVVDVALRADAHELLAYGRAAAGFVGEALAHAEHAVALAPDDRRRSLALARWALCAYYAGRFDSDFDTPLNEAATLAADCGDLLAQATVMRLQALVLSNLKLDFAGAERIGVKALAIWERLGNGTMARFALLNVVTMWAWQGRNEDAAAVMLECERSSMANDDWIGVMHATRQLGRVYIRLRRGREATASLQRSVRVSWEHHLTLGLANAMFHLPEGLVLSGQAELAARLYGFAMAHWARLSPAINRIEAREARRCRLWLHGALGGARFQALRVEGSTLAVTEAVGLALSFRLPPV